MSIYIRRAATSDNAVVSVHAGGRAGTLERIRGWRVLFWNICQFIRGTKEFSAHHAPASAHIMARADKKAAALPFAELISFLKELCFEKINLQTEVSR
ncbi:MAG: hypothetical protein LBD73_06420 [Deferribacteraceae bacterium]|jgi:hypothetical protein|nr:hypothetical protein [Deferribacteraceae bacterium]